MDDLGQPVNGQLGTPACPNSAQVLLAKANECWLKVYEVLRMPQYAASKQLAWMKAWHLQHETFRSIKYAT